MSVLVSHVVFCVWGCVDYKQDTFFVVFLLLFILYALSYIFFLFSERKKAKLKGNLRDEFPPLNFVILDFLFFFT